MVVPGGCFSYNNGVMMQVIDAVYAEGVLKPKIALDFPENQEVRLIVQAISPSTPVEREEAARRFREGVKRMDFHLKGPLPTREELHDRGV